MTGRIPIHLICGFLGAGKTTLLRRLLTEQPRDEKLVVLVNEFGEVGIDGDLLAGLDSEVYEMTSGCICCVLKSDFVLALDNLIERFAPRRIVVEATGLAESRDLGQAVEDLSRRRDVYLASIAVVVDAELFEHRDMLGSLYFRQIEGADLLILNKVDLVPPESVDDLAVALSQINPRARIVPVMHCAVDRDTILAPLRPPTAPDEPPETKTTRLQNFLPDLSRSLAPDSTAGFESFVFKTEALLDLDKLKAFLATLPWTIFRVKGFVRTNEGMMVLNYTYRRPEFGPSEDKGETKIVAIGYNLNPEILANELENCVLKMLED